MTVDDDTFFSIAAVGADYVKQQLWYDRCFDRVVDNRKILSLCGMKQEDIMPLKDGLKRELQNIKECNIDCNKGINERMDKYLESLEF